MLNQTIGYLRWIDNGAPFLVASDLIFLHVWTHCPLEHGADPMVAGIDAWSLDGLVDPKTDQVLLPKTWECCEKHHSLPCPHTHSVLFSLSDKCGLACFAARCDPGQTARGRGAAPTGSLRGRRRLTVRAARLNWQQVVEFSMQLRSALFV